VIGDVIAGVLGKVIDRAWPDPTQKAQALLELEKLKLDGAFRDAELSIKAIVAEAQSADPWTSRARPTFMYVFYGLIVSLVVIAPALGIAAPDQMEQFFANVKAGFEAIPEALWWTFSAGYLGYTGARTFEKRAK
jgi:hypothetical protein